MFGKGGNEQTSQKKLRGWQPVIGGIILVLLLRNCVDSSSRSSPSSASCQEAKVATREAEKNYYDNYQKQLDKKYVDRETIDSTYSTHTVLSAARQREKEACGEEEATTASSATPSAIVSSESSPPSSLSPNSTEASPSTVGVSQTKNSFGFPQTTCGDKPTGANNTWYPVFIDGADLEGIRSKYCADAVATQRKTTGVDTVQLASFTSLERAMVLAQAVGGEVGEPTTPSKFPLSNCGDKPSRRSDTWFPVFIDNGDLANIRRNYCADAVATQRQDTGVATVQLASFTSYDKALAFAKEVGGEVGQATHPAQTTQGSSSQKDSDVENTESDTTANGSVPETYSTPSSIAPSGLTSTSSSVLGGCSSPDDTDSTGRRCGDRAASVRSGGESGSIDSDYSGGSTYVGGYTRSDGTYVRGHYRSRGRR